MAVKAVTYVTDNKGVVQLFWDNLVNNDTGAPADVSDRPDRTVSVQGTFNGATMTLQGSMDGGTVYFTLHDNLGVAITLAAAGSVIVAENTKTIRPSITGGGGSTDLDVYLTAV